VLKHEDGVNYLDFLTEEEYLSHLETLPKENHHLDDKIRISLLRRMGADALLLICFRRLELDELIIQTSSPGEYRNFSQQRKNEALKRLK
jgi:DNA-directed RNA polymerase subunit beta'